MSKFKFITVLLLIMAGIALLLLAQQQNLDRLQAENVSRQQAIDRLATLTREQDNLSAQPAQARPRPSSAAMLGELERLRREVPDQKNTIQEMKSDLAATTNEVPFQKLPGTIRCVELPKESWGSAGCSTPEAALQTMLWATLQGDLDGLRASLTPDELKRRTESVWKDKTEEEIAAAGAQKLGQVSAIQILNLQMLSENEAHFTVYLNGLDQPEQPLWMDLKKIDGTWKSDSSAFKPKSK